MLWKAYHLHNRRFCTGTGLYVASSSEYNLSQLHTGSYSQLQGCIRIQHSIVWKLWQDHDNAVPLIDYKLKFIGLMNKTKLCRFNSYETLAPQKVWWISYSNRLSVGPELLLSHCGEHSLKLNTYSRWHAQSRLLHPSTGRLKCETWRKSGCFEGR